jgi:hypothetical protein
MKLKTTILIISIVLLFSGCSTPQPWTTKNKAFAGVMLAGTAADLASTSYALSNGARELNPLYGSHPSDSTLAISGVVAAGLCLAIAHFLDPRGRNWFLGIVGGGRLAAAVWNTTNTYVYTH